MTKFLKKFITKQIYNYYLLMYFIEEKILKDQKAYNKFANKLITYNNKRVLKEISQKKIKKVSILLPHCIQNYDCPFKVTSNIENCKKCGKCKLGDILNLKEKYNISVKVATGGTLARLYLKEERPDFVIAIACKRDIVSGIFDAFPLNVYGVFNKIINSPCINTDINMDEIDNILNLVFSKGSDNIA